MVSTFFTFCGFEGFPGEMASTRLVSNMQEVESLTAMTSAGIGSVVATPQRVPEPDAQTAPPGADVAIGGSVG